MAIVLDADVVIRGEKGTFDLKSWVKARPNDRFEIAAITVAELWHGVERATGTHKVTRQRYLDALLNFLPIIPYTEQTAYEHARIWAELEASGKMIGFYDLIVGATALERGSHLQQTALWSNKGTERHRTKIVPRERSALLCPPWRSPKLKRPEKAPNGSDLGARFNQFPNQQAFRYKLV